MRLTFILGGLAIEADKLKNKIDYIYKSFHGSIHHDGKCIVSVIKNL